MEQHQLDKKSNKDIIINDEINLKSRLYLYFFCALKKRELTIFMSTIFIIFETIQVISYAFSEPVLLIIFYFLNLLLSIQTYGNWTQIHFIMLI